LKYLYFIGKGVSIVVESDQDKSYNLPGVKPVV